MRGKGNNIINFIEFVRYLWEGAQGHLDGSMFAERINRIGHVLWNRFRVREPGPKQVRVF